MARPREFDPGEAMQEAVEAFWQRGYHATSVSDLLAEMKLNRGSLYGTFGPKKKLFLAALDDYERRGREELKELLDSSGSAHQALRRWVESAARGCSGAEGSRGCLVLKAAMEVAPQDEDVARWLRRITRQRERMVARVIRRAQEQGEMDKQLEPRAAARFLLISLAGLRVLGTSRPAPTEVREVAAFILRGLGL